MRLLGDPTQLSTWFLSPCVSACMLCGVVSCGSLDFHFGNQYGLAVTVTCIRTRAHAPERPVCDARLLSSTGDTTRVEAGVGVPRKTRAHLSRVMGCRLLLLTSVPLHVPGMLHKNSLYSMFGEDYGVCTVRCIPSFSLSPSHSAGVTS